MTPDDFISLICHDIRTPLRGLKALPEWMREESVEQFGEVPDQIEELLGMMESQANRLDDIVADLSNFFKLSRSNDDSLSLLTDALPESEITQHFAIELGVERLPMEQNHLKMVLSELMENALAHGKGKEIQPHLSVSREREFIEITVRDHGDGFDPKFQRIVFEPLRKLKSKDVCEGSGMGLAVVSRIAELYDGECWLTPVGSQGGTQAGFRLRAS